jgi:lactate dehydrogenase-like 2-hydroxyacid dehydrogenase
VKPEILTLTHEIYDRALAQLDQDFANHHVFRETDPDKIIDAVAPRIRAIATSGHKGASAALMDRLPKLEVIACFGVGVDAIDLKAAAQRGVPVTNTPDVLTDEVADLAIGLMLGSARRLPKGDRFVRAGGWLDGPMELTNRVSGARLGILGMGRIGRAIAARAAAFKMTIGWHGPRPKDVPYRYYADLAALAAESDFLVVACPGGAATRHLVNQAVLAALGPRGTLVNVSRGSVVDEPALVAALQGGTLGAAALDVFEDEPRVPARLKALSNVVLTPHIGSATTQTRRAMADLAFANLHAKMSGKALLTPVPECRV